MNPDATATPATINRLAFVNVASTAPRWMGGEIGLMWNWWIGSFDKLLHPQSSSSAIRGALGSEGLALLYALATRTIFTTPAAKPSTRPITNPHGDVWTKKSTPYPSNAPTRMAAPNSPPNLSAKEAALSGGWDVEDVSPRAFATRLRRSSRRSSGGFLFAIERSNARPRGDSGLAPRLRARKLGGGSAPVKQTSLRQTPQIPRSAMRRRKNPQPPRQVQFGSAMASAPMGARADDFIVPRRFW